MLARESWPSLVDLSGSPQWSPIASRVAESAQRNAKAADDLRGHQLTFAGHRFTIRSKGKVIYQGTYIIDPCAKPATIDFRNTAGEMKGKTWLGIYEMEGDVLRICDNADDVAKGRPAAFVAGAGSGHILISFRGMKR
ncbi:MAG TPA: TIGR03067 domain-containing protein [Methylomirabilota bacterium]